MKISLVVPVFNEEDAIPIFLKKVRSYEPFKDFNVEIVFINDGSSDNTENTLNNIVKDDILIRVLHFSRNFGKEPALFAGLEHATGDVIIPIDVDLQDPIEVIPQLIKKYNEGYDVVLAKRTDRTSDTFLKKTTALWFYKFHNKISKPKIEENVGDFRLMSRKVVESIKTLPEKNLFMKGILSWVGFDTAIIEYTREERIAGLTKFNGWKLWNLALEGITSFSSLPLKLWTYIGAFIASLSFLYAFFLIVSKVFWGNPVPGYPSLMTAILFLGGVQLIGIGVLGEYIGRIYIETKNRPKYIIKEKR
ncbi:glycosyltransferase family 2 protein [Actinobacillus equuli subsp. haemolyticus]|uniref:glycosyltransferase family 2 protein n=1 Tax=Actinobacillus equuli TaxID=718 RepID=UPI002441DD89|nr:glycosyltransferase family 2 protein [Actinobacillus equuli]WGE63110.1 glycosyltransferase family 2 protein [Actinobacillus equuli subsp. haemolyticus]